MSSSRIVKSVWATLLVVALFGTGYYVYNMLQKAKDVLFDMNMRNANLRADLLALVDLRHFTLTTENYLLPKDLCRLLPENTCILRLNEVNCIACYAEQLKKWVERMNQENISFFILGSYSNKRQFAADLSGIVTLDSVSYINFPNYEGIPADSLSCPYLFFKSAEGKMEQVYLFQKGEYETLHEYINMLKR